MTKEIESLKNKIKVVNKEIKSEPLKSKKLRLNKYKQKLEQQLRKATFLNAGGKYECSI